MCQHHKPYLSRQTAERSTKGIMQDNRCGNWFGRPWFLDLDDEKETRINNR